MTNREETGFIKNKRLEFAYDVYVEARDLEIKYLDILNANTLINGGVRYNISDTETFDDIKRYASKVKMSIFKNEVYLKALDHLMVLIKEVNFSMYRKDQYGQMIEVILEIIISESCEILGMDYDISKEFNKRHQGFNLKDTKDLFALLQTKFKQPA